MNALFDPHFDQPIFADGEPLASARAAMLLVHARAASADDMLMLAMELDQPGFAYLAPQAAGSIWYPHPEVEPLIENEPWFSSSLALVGRALAQIIEAGIPAHKVILFGFAQGACLVLEYAVRHPQKYGAIVALSGALLGSPSEPRHDQGSLAGTSALLAWGERDASLTLARLERTAQVLRQQGGNVALHTYPDMGQRLNQEEVTLIKEIMANLAR